MTTLETAVALRCCRLRRPAEEGSLRLLLIINQALATYFLTVSHTMVFCPFNVLKKAMKEA